ncbi:MAG: AAA family ATPase [Longimicrobiales bacterium]|nr:AAA family ATPase [Longimicrobiales bacterium]
MECSPRDRSSRWTTAMTGGRTARQLRLGRHITFSDGGVVLHFTDLQESLLLVVADAGEAGLRRERAAEVLWGDQSGRTSPRRRLRQLIYAINQRCPDALLNGDAHTLRLTSEVEVVWTGEAIGGDHDPPTPQWSRLRDEIADRAHARSRTHVASAIDSARLKDDPESILELVASDAVPESRWRDAVWALVRSGRVREAEAAFEKIGIDDPEVVRRCREAVQRLASGGAPGPDPHGAAVPLLGRESVVGAAITALQRDDRRVLLKGPSGVGLTRTLGTVSAWVLSELDDLVIASTRCTDGGKLVAYDTLNRLFDSPLFARAHLEVDEPWRSILARVLRVYGRTPEQEITPLEGTSATLRVLHAISALVDRAIGNATLLVVLDDVHLADPGSLTVLTHLGYDGEGVVIRLLASCRTDIEPDGPVRALFDPEEVTPIEVPPLEADAAEEMLATLRPDLTPEDRRALVGLCHGFPRRLADVARVPDLHGEALHDATLDELLSRRLGGLSEAEQAVAGLLSIRPDGLDAEALVATSGLGLLDLGHAVSRLIDLDIVEDTDPIRIWSSFLRRGIRSRLPHALRRVLHLRIAQALEERDDPPAGSIGRHLFEAGHEDEARDWLLRGAREAAASESFPVAIDLMERAIAAGAEGGDLRESLAEILCSQGRFAEATVHLDRAIDLFRGNDETQQSLKRRLKRLRARAEHSTEVEELGTDILSLLSEARQVGALHLEGEAIDALLRVGDYFLDLRFIRAGHQALLDALDRHPGARDLAWVQVRRAYLDNRGAAAAAARDFIESVKPGSGDELLAISRFISERTLAGAAGDHDVEWALEKAEGLVGKCDPYLRAEILSNFATWHIERGEFDFGKQKLAEANAMTRNMDVPVRLTIGVNLLEIAIRTLDFSTAAQVAKELREFQPLLPRWMLKIDSVQALLALERGELRCAIQALEPWDHITGDFPMSSNETLYFEARLRTLVLAARERDALAFAQSALTRAKCVGMGRMEHDIRRLTQRLHLAIDDSPSL